MPVQDTKNSLLCSSYLHSSNKSYKPTSVGDPEITASVWPAGKTEISQLIHIKRRISLVNEKLFNDEKAFQ